MGWQGEWFGIDDDGHVAMFCFNDAGVAPRVFLDWAASQNPFVPREKRPRFEGAEPITSIADFGPVLPKPSPFRFFVDAGQRAFFPVFGAGNHAKAAKKEVAVWVDDEKSVAADLAAKRARVLADTEKGSLVVFSEYSASIRKKLHGPKRTCRTCLDPMWLEEYLVAGRGLYVYENEYAEWNGPYFCRAAPRKPLEVKTLRKAVRARLERTWLQGCSFDVTPRLQPALHLPCDSTNGRESYYIDFDGRTVKAIPGREDNFQPASFTGDGPTAAPLIVPSPKTKKVAAKQKYAGLRLAGVFEREDRFRELAGTMLRLRSAPWPGLVEPLPFVLIETLSGDRRRCFVGNLRELAKVTRATVAAAKLDAWLDRHAKGWRKWHESSGPMHAKSNEDLFRRLVGDVLPGSGEDEPKKLAHESE